MKRQSPTRSRMAAIFRRDLTLEISYQFQLAIRALGMLVFTTSLFYTSKLVRNPPELRPYGGGYFEFVVIGIIVVLFATVGMNSFKTTIADEQRAGTLEVVLSSPTSLATFLAGSFLAPLLMAVVQMAIYLAAAIVLFRADIPLSGLWLAVPLLALTVLPFCAIGIIAAAFVVLTKRGDPIGLIGGASTLFAGVLFPTSVLPGPVESVTRLVPAYHGLEGLRAVLLTGAGLGDIVGDLLSLACFVAVLMPVALWCFSRAIRTARVTGTLGNY